LKLCPFGALGHLFCFALLLEQME